MRILIVPDIKSWAIGHLADSVITFNDRHQIDMLCIHPRDAGSTEVQQEFLKYVKEFNPDLIQFEYFRTAGQLVEALPELHNYKLVVMHHNMRTKALYMWDWENNPELDKTHLKFDKVLVHCTKTKKLLEEKGYAKDVKVIRYGFDHNYWTYSGEEPRDFFIGYGGRITKWKGLKELSEIAKEENFNVQIMGKVDKEDYWNECTKDNLKFDFMECKDEERKDFFRNITIFVQNAKDGYESGPMPMLEAMACGVPVITTPAGQAGEYEGIFQDRKNCLMIPFEDKEALREAINELKNDAELRKQLRKAGWETVKTMTEEKMAKEYSMVWNKVIHPEHPLVSIIIPTTYARQEKLKETLKAISQQSYQNIEVIIIWDDEIDYKAFISSQKPYTLIDKTLYNFPIKEVWTNMNKNIHPYNLAMARNLGIIEAEGEILVFNDSRLAMDESAVMMFVEAIKNAGSITEKQNKKCWFFGDKGSQKQSFVENFSAIKREYLINAGLFCERIVQYGGMTQEIRSRWKKQGGTTMYLSQAVTEEIMSSKNSNRRQDIINSKTTLYKMYGDKKI